MDKTPTPSVEQAIRIANNWAKANNLPRPNLPLLLYSIIFTRDNLAAKLIEDYGAKELGYKGLVKHLCEQLTTGLKAPSKAATAVTNPGTEAKRSMEFAAQITPSHQFGPEHLLYGILKVNQNSQTLAVAFSNFTIDPNQLIEWLTANIKQAIPSTNGPTAAPTTPPVKPLEAFTKDLTKMAADNRLDPVIGRESEIHQAFKTLARRTKNNVLLYGESGAGKTAIVEGIAQAIHKKTAPKEFHNTSIRTLDLASAIAGTLYRGQFEERLKAVIRELEGTDTILFIDDFQTILGAGNTTEGLNASSILRPAWNRGLFKTIGATSTTHYEEIARKHDDIKRCFRPLKVAETTLAQTTQILRQLRSTYEKHHGVAWPDVTIEAAVKLSQRYIRDRVLPDKAIDLLDEASANARLNAQPSNENQQELVRLEAQKKEAVQADSLIFAASIKEKIDLLKNAKTNTTITPDDIARVVADWSGIPVDRIQSGDTAVFQRSEAYIQHHMIGQAKAVKTMLQALRRARSPIRNPKRPIGVYIYAGPTGVGKTLLARLACEGLGGSKDHFIKIDMGDLQQKHQASQLLGSPPGFAKCEEDGRLRQVNRQPYTVVLFDEIEKAHPDIFDVLLAIMDDGQLIDAAGQPIYFHDTILIMTTNLGCSAAQREPLGYAVPNAVAMQEARKRETEKAIANFFRPEFLNRVDEVIVFDPLGKPEMEAILDLELQELQSRRAGFSVELLPAARTAILNKGFNPQFGARPLKRAITTMIEDPITNALEARALTLSEPIQISLDGTGEIQVQNQRKEPAEAITPPQLATVAA